jgi:putative ABC transport system permease protein
MITNNLKPAFRNLFRNKLYSSLNIAGLSIGLTFSILLLLWVQDELSFNAFHEKAPQLYQVNAHFGTGIDKQSWGVSPATIAPYSLREIPEVSGAVRLAENYDVGIMEVGNQKIYEKKLSYVDSSFFQLLTFPLLKGNVDRPFPTLQSVVVNETFAKTYFGSTDVIGKTIIADKKDNYVISGVMADFPKNSSFRFDIVFSYELFKARFGGNMDWKTRDEDWGNFVGATFLYVKSEKNVPTIEKKLTDLIEKHNQYSEGTTFTLQPISQTYLYKADGSDGGIQTVRIFAIIAFIILLIACINYMNLTTAIATQRAKEVSVRKIIGAHKLQLFKQFMVESSLIFIISLAISLVLIYLFMPIYNQVAAKEMTFNLFNTNVLLVIGIAFFITLLVAGIYPALLLTNFNPIQVLKGKKMLGNTSNANFRKVLVISQFAFSVVLIISTFVIGRQLTYIKEKNLGYDRENVITTYMREETKQKYEAIKNELQKNAAILGITTSGGDIHNLGNTTGDTEWDGKAPKSVFLIHPMSVDRNFLDVFKIKLVTGKGFTGTPADSSYFILNETAIKEAGITDPIGKRFKLWDIEGTIAGVVQDFHFASIKQKIRPAIFYFRPYNNYKMYIKTKGKDLQNVIADSERLWKQNSPDYPFHYEFLDEAYGKLYQSEQTTSTLFNYFAGIAIFIACLGLFGLATYTAQSKTKEIGIRKVLGANVSTLIFMLSKDFLKLILVACIIAFPVAYYLIDKWLADFAYRIGIGAGEFVIAGMSICLTALLTVSYQAIKAAVANPVKSLRSE